MRGLALLDASAFWRLGSGHLDVERRREITDRILPRNRRGQHSPATRDPGGTGLARRRSRRAPLLWNGDRSERRAAELQLQLRAAHRHLGVPPMGYLIAAIAEEHGAAILHYDADFDRVAAYTDLAVPTEQLAPLGSLP